MTKEEDKFSAFRTSGWLFIELGEVLRLGFVTAAEYATDTLRLVQVDLRACC